MKTLNAPGTLGSAMTTLHNVVVAYPAEAMVVAAVLFGVLCFWLADWV